MTDTPVICGFSGTLKSTISKLLFPDKKFLNSPTKFFRNYNDYYCDSCLDINPIHMIGLRWNILENFNDGNFVIERSVLDYIYFAITMKVHEFDDESWYIKMKFLEHDEELIGNPYYIIIKNNASDFIKNKVLGSDPSRNDVYQSLDQYFYIQDDYLKFITKRLNNYKLIELNDQLADEIINNNKTTLLKLLNV